MEYLFTFVEGITVFISPCMFPMLPIYLSYFSGSSSGEQSTKKTVINVLGFILGFSSVFIALGAFSSIIGSFLIEYRRLIDVISGVIMIIFGLSNIGLFKGGFMVSGGSRKTKMVLTDLNFKKSYLFGIMFSLTWSACLTPFLAHAIVLASSSGTTLKGALTLLCFSLGLGLPFLISSLLITQLSAVFDFIRKNYNKIKIVSGLFLIFVGISMITGWFGKLLSALSY